MKATIEKIAEVAGVSRGTVDRALHNRKGIKPEVAERVRKVAEELNYEPDMAARALVQNRYQKSQKIGVVLCSKGNPFFNDVKDGIRDAADHFKMFGMKFELVELRGYNEREQLKAIEKLEKKGVAGLVMTPVNTKAISSKIRALKEQNIETVTINTDIQGGTNLAYVGCDYLRSGYVAAELWGLISEEISRKIVVVIGSHLVLAHEQRLQGLRRQLEKAFPQVEIQEVIENEDSDEISYQKVKAYLEANPQINGISFIGAGVKGGLKAVEELGLQKKLRIITYDLTDIVKKNLRQRVINASICQEPYVQGNMGIHIIGDYMLQGKRPSQRDFLVKTFVATKYVEA